jgi:hypothetical protein
MAEKFDRYECLLDALYRFACGQWPPAGHEFKWRSPEEVERALTWIAELELEHEDAEMEERAERYERRKARTAADVVKLVPPKSDGGDAA